MNDDIKNQDDLNQASTLEPEINEETQVPEPEIEPGVESEETQEEVRTDAKSDGVEDTDPVAEETQETKDEETKSDGVETSESADAPTETEDQVTTEEPVVDTKPSNPNEKWYVVHTYSGHENKVAQALLQRVESEHLEHKIIDVLVPTQDKIEIKSGKKESVKEKIFPGYILVKMVLDDSSWLAVRTTQGVTSFVGIGNKPTPIPESEVKTIVKFMNQGATSTFKDVYVVNDTIKIIDGPFSDFIGKVDGVDKEKGKVRVLVSIFGRETPVELDFLQVQKL